MLQMKFCIFLTMFSSLFAAGWLHSADSGNVEWVFENTFEKEYVSVNEATVIVSDELEKAMEYYHHGNYRRAAELLYEVRRLNLPDGSIDFVAFVLAECWRKTGLHKKALDEYRFVASRFSVTDKRPPALYRIIEYYARERMIDQADSVRMIFSGAYKNHGLYNSVLYECGKLYYDSERYEEATALLQEISPGSIRHIQASMLTALCRVQVEDWKNAVLLLDYVIKHAKDVSMRTEALLVMGDIHYRNNRLDEAMDMYRRVPRKAVRYEYALVKTARCLYDKGEFEKTVLMGNAFFRRNSRSDYYFEMASIVEQAYLGMGMEKEAAQAGAGIHDRIVGSRMTFEIYDEIDRVAEIVKLYRIRGAKAISRRDTVSLLRATERARAGEDIQRRLNLLLDHIEQPLSGDRKPVSEDFAVRRYLALLKKGMDRAEDSILLVRQRLHTADSLSKTESDSTRLPAKDSLDRVLSRLQKDFRDAEHEHDLIIAECLGGEAEGRRESEEVQAKFIDWEFMKYLEKKERSIDLARKLSESRRNRSAPSDTPENTLSDSSVTQTVDAQAELLRLDRLIEDERERLIGHIETMIDLYPRSRYITAVLFRLAELYVDLAADRFEEKMAFYEQAVKASSDTGEIPFPEYDLSQAIAIYQRIFGEFPDDRHADDAMYYCAQALRRQGIEDSAQKVMISLIEKYPRSEYYIEANMSIGKYHFEHPKEFGGDGYRLAEEAFRNVLFYRDHPQFVQALYHLGWCYYMQDRYEEAIYAFKYMVDEVELEFDPLKKEEKELSNPLLRSEAIDYLAISFEQGDSMDAEKFLEPIGNDDYTALVLMRMGELREEDLDFTGAIDIYKRIVDAYLLSSSSPRAAARLIKLYENGGDSAGVARESDNFIRNYSAAGDWQKRIGDRDSALLVNTDSMVISIGLSVADNMYRSAEASGDFASYRNVAAQYRRIVDCYPEHPGAADAAWNLAALLDRIGEKTSAFERFMNFSGYPGVDSVRRETAALNAVAIAQLLLPPDSLLKKGEMDSAGGRLIRAVENYALCFPGGGSLAHVFFTMGGVYFNRRMFDEAAEIYRRIIDTPGFFSRHVEAQLLLGQCRFGAEKWAEAVEIFDKVRNGSSDESQRNQAYTFMLQSRYFGAKEMMNKKMYDKAAIAFKEIDELFPGSEYGDIALFNSAEALEKNEQWIKASDRYNELVNRYPGSRYASDALFNAAGDLEKAQKYAAAAQTYELIVERYPGSLKAKDALFNLGFCYEKLGKIDAMVSANERYSTLYPEEKDVEALLMRSANYYAKTGMFGKAIELYRNFIRRFPQSGKTVEAYYMIGKCHFDANDNSNALINFEMAERHNARMALEGGDVNHYFASEAAFGRAAILRDKFKAVKLRQPQSQYTLSLQEKSGYLAEALDAYQNVIKYQSDKMFEAAFRMGELYEELANALVEQERPRTDPIQAALRENEILMAASDIMRKAVVPYEKSMKLAAQFDTLSRQQQEWVDSARLRMGDALLQAGAFLYNGVGAIQNAPVPDEIRAKPLLHYQYRIKVLETVEPMKINVLGYFGSMLDSLGELHLDDSVMILCELNVARLNFLMGGAYDRLAQEILRDTDKLPRNMPENEREDLLFQLEDIVYELQDKALERFEAARSRMEEKKLEATPWHGKILEALARLNPEKHGAYFYVKEFYKSDETWLAREDSVQAWNSAGIEPQGWSAVTSEEAPPSVAAAIPDNGRLLLGQEGWKRMYLWKNIVLSGKPRNGRIAVFAPGKYRLYVNGILTLSDTLGNLKQTAYDSADGIVSLLRGGDNIIACEVGDSLSVNHGVAVGLMVLLDTTEHFSSSIRSPNVARRSHAGDSTLTTASADSVASKKSAPGVSGPAGTSVEKMGRREVLKAIETYRERERRALAALRLERLEVQKLRLRKAQMEEERLKAAQQEKKTTGSPAVIPPFSPR